MIPRFCYSKLDGEIDINRSLSDGYIGIVVEEDFFIQTKFGFRFFALFFRHV